MVFRRACRLFGFQPAGVIVASASVVVGASLLSESAECKSVEKHNYLVGDIGGTKSRLRLYQAESELSDETCVASKTFPSQEYDSLTTIIDEFLSENKELLEKNGSPAACVMAVAGPVEMNCATMPNTGWSMSADKMQKYLNIKKVVLLNDFVGVGYGILGLQKDDYHVIQDKACNPVGPIVVFGPGTGLGQAYLTYDGEDYTVWPSEGGHVDWAPRNNQEMRLWHFLKARLRSRLRKQGLTKIVDHVSQERVISGSGIPDLYDFFRSEYPDFIDERIETKMKNMPKSAVVSIHAHKKDNYICQQAMKQWAKSFGQAVGDVALTYMPTGGIYIAGGVAPKNLEILRENKFTEWVNAKGRLTSVIGNIPVFVVKENVPVGLVGARVVARRVLKDAYPEEHIHAESQPQNRQESELLHETQYPEMLHIHGFTD